MDYIALEGVNFFLKRRKKLLLLLLVSFLGSFVSLILQLKIQDAGIRTILLHFPVNIGMTMLAFGWTGKKAFIENWCFIYLTILFLGGFMEWEEGLGMPHAFFLIKAITAAMILTVTTIYFMQKNQFMKQIYSVDLLYKGTKVSVRAYWDSGNLLVDPYVNEPVHILREKYAKQLLSLGESVTRLVPYHSLGNENGLIEVFSVDAMVIKQGTKEQMIKPAVIGIEKEGLLVDLEYDMILQANVLERGEII